MWITVGNLSHAQSPAHRRANGRFVEQQEMEMDKQNVEISLLSDDELDAVAGGESIALQVYCVVKNAEIRTFNALNNIYEAFNACR
jgi:hypothetical protein